MEREFWGGEDLDVGPWVPPANTSLPPPYNPQLPSNKPAIDPADVPLPMATEPPASDSIYPSTSKDALISALKEQEAAMRSLLAQMEGLDRGSSEKSVRDASAQAHQAVVEELNNVERQLYSLTRCLILPYRMPQMSHLAMCLGLIHNKK